MFLNLKAKVIAVEPDPTSVRVLRRRFLFRRQHHVVSAALAGATRRQKLLIKEPGSAYNTLSPEWHARNGGGSDTESAVWVDVLTLDQLIARWGNPSFVKIDVEGFESEVLSGLSHPVNTLTLEANLALFRDKTLRCIEILQRLSPSYRFNAF